MSIEINGSYNPYKSYYPDNQKTNQEETNDVEKEQDSKQPTSKNKLNNAEEPVKVFITNTDKVDREIKHLREKQKQLQQQIKSAYGDEEKVKELQKKLAQVESELMQKDNDTYRRQNSSVSG